MLRCTIEWGTYFYSLRVSLPVVRCGVGVLGVFLILLYALFFLLPTYLKDKYPLSLLPTQTDRKTDRQTITSIYFLKKIIYRNFFKKFYFLIVCLSILLLKA